MSTPELISYIVSRHHAYLLVALPFIEGLACELEAAHREREPRVVGLCRALVSLTRELRSHLYDEEAVLFPALRAHLTNAGVLADELRKMREEHARVGAQLSAARALTEACAASLGGDASHDALVRMVADLEADTMRHIHLETQILMTRVASAGARPSRLPR